MVQFFNPHTDKAPQIDRGAYYRSETKYLAQLTGQEIPDDKRNFHKAIRYVNQASQLGLDEVELEVLGRMLTVLSHNSRFVGEIGMTRKSGENPATHSLQSVNVMEKQLHALARHWEHYAKDTTDTMDNGELQAIRQFTGLGLILHDMGEALGELKTVALPGIQPYPECTVEQLGKDQWRQKMGAHHLAMERRILEHVLLLAFVSVEHGESREAFTQKIHGLSETININARINAESPKERTITMQELEQHLTSCPSSQLSEENTQRFKQMMALWDMAEQPEKPLEATEVNLPENPAFVGNLIKNIEHVQGARHFMRFSKKESDNNTNTQPLATFEKNKIESNLSYIEAELAKLFAHANTGLEKELSKVQRDFTYATAMDVLDNILAPYRCAEIEARAGDMQQQYKTAEHYLQALERLQGAYEHAILHDEIPQPGQRNLAGELVKQYQSVEENVAEKDDAMAADTTQPKSVVASVQRARARIANGTDTGIAA